MKCFSKTLDKALQRLFLSFLLNCLGLSIFIFFYSFQSLADHSFRSITQRQMGLNSLGGLKIAVNGDFLSSVSLMESDSYNLIEPREVDFLFYAPVDHLFDATTSFVFHKEGGVYKPGLHEAYLSSHFLIPGVQIKAGQFFLGIGRLNRLHRHEWPFTEASEFYERFFDKEGVFDSGLEASLLLPVSFYLDLTVGVTKGFIFGHTHGGGLRPRLPTHYLRLASFFSFTTSSGIEMGFNFLRRKGVSHNYKFFGLDLTGKKMEGRILRWLFQSEVWLRDSLLESNRSDKEVMGYFFPQYAWDARWLFGGRVDFFSNLSLKEGGEFKSNLSWGFSPTLTFKMSEFSFARLSYKEVRHDKNGVIFKKNSVERWIQLQVNFSLGAHAAHSF